MTATALEQLETVSSTSTTWSFFALFPSVSTNAPMMMSGPGRYGLATLPIDELGQNLCQMCGVNATVCWASPGTISVRCYSASQITLGPVLGSRPSLEHRRRLQHIWPLASGGQLKNKIVSDYTTEIDDQWSSRSSANGNDWRAKIKVDVYH